MSSRRRNHRSRACERRHEPAGVHDGETPNVGVYDGPVDDNCTDELARSV